MRTTYGSKLYEDSVPERDSVTVSRIRDEGGIILGKTNAPEFGHKGTTDNRVIGPTSTLFDLNRNAGDSSGGSAATVADGLVPMAQGSDGGGSVRIPASFCGIYGFKASYGRVAQAIRPDAFLSHTPTIHAGPLTRTVEDAALVTEVMAGPHPRDPLSVPDDNPDYQGAVRQGIEDLDIAYSPTFETFPVDDRVQTVVDGAANAFEQAGATVEEIGVGIDHSQQELADLWIRQIGMLYHSALEGFKDEGLDVLGDHRGELSPEFAEMLEDTQDISAIEYKRDEHVRTEVYDAI